jgi:hypothetical protein
MDDVEKKLKSVGTVSKKFTIPMLFWEEWEEDCRLNYNNTYHLKMLSDHEFKKQFNSIANLLVEDVLSLRDRVFELEAKVAELSKPVVEEPKAPAKTKTFGGR